LISPEYLAGFFDADGYVGVTKAAQLKLALEFPIGRKVQKGEFSAPKVDKQEQIRVYEQIKALKQERETN
jgi:hypothetical protein